MKGPAQVSQLCLAHETGKTRTQRFNTTTTTTHWVLHPLGDARRPTSGTETFGVHCANCQKAVQVAVPAESVVMKKQRKQRRRGWLTVLVAVATFVTALVGVKNPVTEGWLIIASAVLLPIGFLIAFTTKSVHGVRVSDVRDMRLHSIRKRPVR